MIIQIDFENDNYNLTTQQTVLTHTPSSSEAYQCQGLLLLGDGSDDLDGSGGDFELTVTIANRTVQPDPQKITYSIAVQSGVLTGVFPVPANAEVTLKVKSPNAGDTDVDVSAYLFQTDAAGGWDERLTGATHNVPTSAGRRLRELSSSVAYSGTVAATGSSSNQIQLENDASSNDKAYDPSIVLLRHDDGRTIIARGTEYTGSTRLLQVREDMPVVPDDDWEILIFAEPGGLSTNEGAVRGIPANETYQGQTVTKVQLNALAPSGNVSGQTVYITGGTGADYAGVVVSYNGTTKEALIYPAFPVLPVAGSSYELLPTSLSCIKSTNGTPLTSDNFPTAAQIDTLLSLIHGPGSWQSAGSGSGANTVTLTIEDENNNPVHQAIVGIRNAAGQTLGISGITDTLGQVTFALDNATYQVIIQRTGYSFTVPEVLIVSGDTSETYTGNSIIPSTPTPGTQTLYSYVNQITGDAAENDLLKAELAFIPQSQSGVVIDSEQLQSSVDSNGYAEISVIQGAKARITIENENGEIFFDRTITITTDATRDLVDYL